LFVYSPIFLFAIIGCAMIWNAKESIPLLKFLSIGALLVVLLYSKWSFWWGGETYGPRLLADIAPLLTLFLIPLRTALKSRTVVKLLFVIFTVWSVAAHAVGAFAADPFWNQRNHVDESQAALWQWEDNQLINPIRNAMIRFLARAEKYPNSRSAPEFLGASYLVEINHMSSAKHDPIELSFLASNTGKAIWLAKNGKAGVKLVCEWFPKDAAPHPKVLGLDYDVFLHESYLWHVAIEPPIAPGNYYLLLGLSTGKIGFAKEKIEPARINVDVLSSGGWRAECLSQSYHGAK